MLPKVSRLLHLKSRDSCYISISLRPRGLRQAPYLHFHLSSFIFHRTPARKFPERLSSPSQRPPERFPTLPPEIARFPFGTKVIKILDLSPYLPPTRPFTLSPTLPYSPKPVFPIPKASSSPTTPPDRIRFSRSSISLHVYPNLTLSYNNTHQSSSLPTMPPDRIHSSRSSIAFHDLSSSHPALQQHSSVQVITSYNYQVRFPDSSPCTVLLPIPQNQSFTNHATRQNPLLSFINLLARSILISPCLTTTLISPVHHFPQLPSSLSRQAHPHCYPSDWEFTTRHARNCTEFEAVSTYVTLKK